MTRHLATLARSSATPFVALLCFTVLLLLQYETSAFDVVRYLAYVAYGIVLPGTLIWRTARQRPAPLIEDLAAGTAVGYALELFVYLAARAAGVPLAVGVWPAVVVAVCLAVPRLRPAWGRASSRERPPLWWSWTIATILAVVFLTGAAEFYRLYGLTWPWSAASYFDTLYHLALAGEAKHHFPPTTPYVLGEPLHYHWFVHAHIAASSWISGVELQVIVYRLSALPMLAAFVVLLSASARRISGKWWVGAIAAGLTFLVSSPSPYQWTQDAFWDLSLLGFSLWANPPQTYGATLFAAAILIVVERLRRDPGGKGDRVVLAVLLAAVGGSKATFLPLLLAGLAVVGLVMLVVHRGIDTVAVRAGALAAGLLAFSSLVLFGGSAHALQAAPLETLRILSVLRGSNLSGIPVGGLPAWFVLLLTTLVLLAWLARTAGLIGLVLRRDRMLDPPVLLLTGIALAGILLTLLLRHPGSSQLYFVRSAAPYLAVLSACGLAALIEPARATRRVAVVLLTATLVGATAAWVVSRLAQPARPAGPPGVFATALLQPIVILGVVLVVAAGALLLARTRLVALRGISLALIVAAVLGSGLAPTTDRLVGQGRTALAAHRDVPAPAPGERLMPEGAIEAARWLRDHSHPDDIVATNTHCRVVRDQQCDNRHFWISAFSERRVLVESWGYTTRLLSTAWDGPTHLFYMAYWDPQKLAENDRAFRQPSRANIGLLRTKYGVRWLFVDERHDAPASTLDDHATLRFRSGDCSVYEVTSGAPSKAALSKSGP